MTDTPPSSQSALDESFQLLADLETTVYGDGLEDVDVDVDYGEFAIGSDSDDEDDNEGGNSDPLTSTAIKLDDPLSSLAITPSASTDTETEPNTETEMETDGMETMSLEGSTNGNSEGLISTAAPPPPPAPHPPPTLTKQSVDPMEDPLSSFASDPLPPPAYTPSTVPLLPTNRQTYKPNRPPPNSHLRQPHPPPSTATSNPLSSFLPNKPQSLTSHFSSFASKAASSIQDVRGAVQDVVSTAHRVNVNTAPSGERATSNTGSSHGSQGGSSHGTSLASGGIGMGGGGMGMGMGGVGGIGSGVGAGVGAMMGNVTGAVGSMGARLMGTGKVAPNTNTTTTATPTVYGAGGSAAGAAATGFGATSGGGMRRPVPDLDNTKKTALITSAMGKLLPGERVIVFLPSLIGVRESSLPHTEVGSKLFPSTYGNTEDDDTVWCCAITYYRLIVFSYLRSEFQDLLEGNNSNESNASSSFTVKGEERLARLLRTSSTSRQFQHMQSDYFYNRTKRHHVIQMPLASIDRVSRLSDKKVAQSTGMNTSRHSGGAGPSLKVGGYQFDASTIGGVVDRAVGGGGPPMIGNGGVTMSTASPAGIIVYGKDNLRTIQFSSYQDCSKAIESLTTFAFPGGKNLGYLFAFESRRTEFTANVQKRKAVAAAASAAAAAGDEADPSLSKTVPPIRATPRRYDALLEFHRMGVLQPRTYPAPKINTDDGMGSSHDGTFALPTPPTHRQFPAPWRPILKANANYELCPTYPSVLFGPHSVDEDTPEGLRLIRETAAFRCGGRMQTLCWASRHDGASLWRSAQPRVGLQGNRSGYDETYMRMIGEQAALANDCARGMPGRERRPGVGFLKMMTGAMDEKELMVDGEGIGGGVKRCLVKVMDLRPKSAAIANRTGGYGYENTSNYKNMSLSFQGIGNIHAVRDSYLKLSNLCTSPSTNDVKWGELVEETKWLYHIRLILTSAWQAAFHVRYNRLPVIVHCSHGWDRTSQVCSLAQLFLDPYYRTRVGFSCLIEKDFLALGHPFHTRCGHGEGRGDSGSSSGSSDNGQISPIFIQFLDCAFQIVNQYPDYFEFNTKYLLLLSEHVYSCRFGTLLCDSEKERETIASIRQRTPCLWEYLDSFPDLINPYYLGNKKGKTLTDGEGTIMEGNDGTLMMPLPTLLRNVTLWVDRHCMHGPKATLRCLPEDVLLRDVEHPLLEKNDLNGFILENALAEASKWKKIAEEREEELRLLRNPEETTEATEATTADIAE